jgi:hypothetical protein
MKPQHIKLIFAVVATTGVIVAPALVALAMIAVLFYMLGDAIVDLFK